VRSLPIALALAAAAAGVSCHRFMSSGPVEPALAACVPPSATLLAGVDLDALRRSELYRNLRLPPITILENAGYLLAASDGSQFLLAARGNFAQTPAGATLLGRNLALAGAPDLVRIATAQRAAGQPGNTGILRLASRIAEGAPAWAVASGPVSLPLTGNAANLNRLFRSTRSAGIALTLEGRANFSLSAECADDASAREFEENLRAILSLLGRFEAVRVHRDSTAVHATFAASPDVLRKLIPAR
jgi:hypothetical protein